MSGAVNDGEDGGVIFKSRRLICRRWSAVVGTPATVWWAGLAVLGTGRAGWGNGDWQGIHNARKSMRGEGAIAV